MNGSSLANRKSANNTSPEPTILKMVDAFGHDYPVLKQSKLGVGYAVFDLTIPNIFQK